MICFTPQAMQMTAYFYAVGFFLMGVITGVVIMKIRFNRILKKKQ